MPGAWLRDKTGLAAVPALLLGLVLTLSGCAVNPATGESNLVLMGEDREKEIGEEEHEKVVSGATVMGDGEITDYVASVGQRVAEASHRPDLDYTFTVIDSPEINAFALPGGYIYINRGLLAYLNSEDELAAVLAHEIGHVTARHAVQQHARGQLSNIAANVTGVVAAVATGSGYIGSEIAQLGSVWAAAGVSGFGREHELEADRLSAEYLRDAGYDPQAVIEVISVLKNQEDFNVRVANRQPSYHGVFSTHPRNDQRLQEAVGEVGEPSSEPEYQPDPAVFREHTDGLVFGERQGSESRNRYYQDTLGYTLVFPDEWSTSETPSTVTASSPEGSAELYIEPRRLQQRKDPREYMRENLGLDNLQETEQLQQYRLRGYTGINPDPRDGVAERVAVLYLGPRAIILRGTIHDGEQLEEMDRLLLGSIRSLRAIQLNERRQGELRVRYLQAGENFSWEQLAQQSRVPQYAEETLRLINGYYPRGEPEPGEWIKTLR